MVETRSFPSQTNEPLVRGRIFEPTNRSNKTKLGYGHHETWGIYTAAHQWDVDEMQLRIGEYIELQREWRQKRIEVNNTLPLRDLNLLLKLRIRMQKKKPVPTLRWLLDNHEYFEQHRNESCALIW